MPEGKERSEKNKLPDSEGGGGAAKKEKRGGKPSLTHLFFKEERIYRALPPRKRGGLVIGDETGRGKGGFGLSEKRIHHGYAVEERKIMRAKEGWMKENRLRE